MTARSRPIGLANGFALGCLALAAFAAPSAVSPASPLAQAAPKPQPYLRNPAGHGSTVVFEHDDHIWMQRGDGVAQRITDAANREAVPLVSPDGSLVAYVAVTELGHEIFVASLEAGSSSRLTFDGGADAKVQGWLSPTEVLYSTTMRSGKRGPLLFTVDIRTKSSRAIPLAEAAEGCVLGEDFIYVRNQELVDSNRLYQGGYAQKIYRIRSDLVFGPPPKGVSETNPSVPLTEGYAGISRSPLCLRERIFFLSDRDTRFNIWSMTRDGQDLVQHTFEKDYDIRSMTTDLSVIYYQRAGEVFRLDPAGGSGTRVAIHFPAARAASKERFVFDQALATDVVVSDDGRKIGLVVRGKLWAADLGSGAATCIECHSGRRVKSPVMSSDGATLFALHDASGEYDLYAYDLKSGAARRVANAVEEPILDFSVSPNGRSFLVRSIAGNLYRVDVASGETTRLDLASRSRPENIVWSPDSLFAAFVTYNRDGIGRVTAFDSVCGSITYLTSGRFHVSSPVFSQDGSEIFFIAQTNLRSSIDEAWGPTHYWPSYDHRSLIQSVDVGALTRRPTEIGPFGKSGASAAGGRGAKCPSQVAERAASREDLLLVRELPFVAGNYDGLSLLGGRLYALSRRAPRDEWSQFVAFGRDLQGRRSAPQNVLGERIYGYAASAKGRTIVARTASGSILLCSLEASGDFGPPAALPDLQGLETEIDLAQEREQIFNEIWRTYRDYFWDSKMNGVDWEKLREKFRAFLPRVSSRAELDEVVVSMVAELGAGHTSPSIPLSGAELHQGVARLGGEFSEEDGLRVLEIFDGDLDNMEERSPLSSTSPPLAVGDRITHVNGFAVRSRFMLDQLLYDRVGQSVILRVAKPDGRILENRVETTSAGHEAWLRNRAWAAQNPQLVDRLSGEKVGYIHLAAAFEADFSSFLRQYAPLHQREALILDLRSNNGGNIDAWLLNFLQRRRWLQVADRNDSLAMSYPRESFAGRLIVLIDGDTYSNGELIAEGVRRLGLGILIGTRTSGAGMWVNDEKTLIDGSRLRIPEAGSYYLENDQRRFIIEGKGVEPDIHVANDPYLFFCGIDAQLETAVDYAIKTFRPKPTHL